MPLDMEKLNFAYVLDEGNDSLLHLHYLFPLSILDGVHELNGYPRDTEDLEVMNVKSYF